MKRANLKKLPTMIPTIWYTRKDNKRSVIARSGWGGNVNRQSTKDLYGSKNTLCNIIMVNICHCTFVQNHRLYNKNEPYVKYGLWMIMMCQCRFILCRTCTTLVSDVDNERRYACVAAEGIWKISVHSSHYYYKPKAAPKNVFKERGQNIS